GPAPPAEPAARLPQTRSRRVRGPCGVPTPPSQVVFLLEGAAGTTRHGLQEKPMKSRCALVEITGKPSSCCSIAHGAGLELPRDVSAPCEPREHDSRSGEKT